MNLFKFPLRHILPKPWLIRLAGQGTNKRAGWLTELVINLFVKYYKVDMKEIRKPGIASCHTSNEFLVHPPRDEVHPVNTDPNVLIMPADDVISQLDKIEGDKILQIKGHNYNLEALLTGSYLMTGLFRNDTFVATCLSPRDYHHIHIPRNGILREMTYVPGDLFSINHLTAQNMPSLFAYNEYVICLLDTEFGLVAQIPIGVTIAGGIETIWVGTIMPLREGIIKRWTWLVGENGGSVALLKGQEVGRFRLNSAVINLSAPDKANLIGQLESLSITKISQPLVIPTETSITPDAEPALLPAEEIETEHDASPLIDDKKDQV